MLNLLWGPGNIGPGLFQKGKIVGLSEDQKPGVAFAVGGTNWAAVRNYFGTDAVESALCRLADCATAKTDNYVATAADNTKHFTNAGASGNTYIQWPAAVPGAVFAYTRTAAYAYSSKPAAGEKFRGQVANKRLELTADRRVHRMGGAIAGEPCLRGPGGLWDGRSPRTVPKAGSRPDALSRGQARGKPGTLAGGRIGGGRFFCRKC